MTATAALGRYTAWHRQRERLRAFGWVLRIDADHLVWAVPGWLRHNRPGPSTLVPRTDGPSKALLGAVSPSDPDACRSAARIAAALGWRVTGAWTTADRYPACPMRMPVTHPPRTVRGTDSLEGETS